MPKIISRDQLNQLSARFSGHQAGLGVEELLRQSPPGTARRTLQRRLTMLIAQQRIETVGVGRGLRYRMVSPLTSTAPVVRQPTLAYGLGESYGPLSPEGAAVRDLVRRPRQIRQPVAYQIQFLEAYQPNRTFYLPDALRGQLHSMGQSPSQHAPAGTFARDILARLTIDLAWASSRLEGNTYSRLDTERLIAFGEAARGKDALETQMILNHKAAIEFLVGDPVQAVITRETVIALHALLSDGLMADPAAVGALRKRAVEIGGSVYLPLAVPQKIDELFGIVLAMAAEITDPFEQAFFLMVHIPYLQPFEDVNKRVSRLAANIPLIGHNLAPLSFIDVPPDAYVEAMLGIYEQNRVELLRDVFLWAYERSCRQYVAVLHQLVPPDTFRLRYRKELAATVRAIVQGGHDASAAAINALMPADVTAADRARLVTQVENEFASLHAGNAVRFGLRALDFETWRSGVHLKVGQSRAEPDQLAAKVKTKAGKKARG